MAVNPKDVKRSYVYAILVDGVIRYVGKGTGDRIYHHVKHAQYLNRKRAEGSSIRAVKFHNRLAKALKGGAIVSSEFLYEGLTSQEAYDLEVEMIASFPKEQIWNQLSGGEGLSSEDAKKMWSDPKHKERMKKIRSDPAFIEKQRQNTIKQFEDPEAKRRHSELSKECWKDPIFREKTIEAVRAGVSKPESRAKVKQAIERRYSDPRKREERGIITSSYMNKPENKAKMKLVMENNWNDPEIRSKMLAQWSDPESIKKRAENLTPEFLQERGKAISEGHSKSSKVKQYQEARAFKVVQRRANLVCAVLGFGS